MHEFEHLPSGTCRCDEGQARCGLRSAELLPPEYHANLAFTVTSKGQIPPKSYSYPWMANPLFFHKFAREFMRICRARRKYIYVER